MPFEDTMSNSGRGKFNTLAQSGTGIKGQATKTHTTTVSGRGTDLHKKDQISAWAKRKTITQIMMLSLANVATEKKAMKRAQAYWNTFHCLSEAKSVNGKLYGKYCKNSFCALCLGIRKAKLINQYLPVLKKWDHPFFVTLTVKAVKKELLPKVFGKVIQGFRRITSKYRKRNARGKDIMLVGLKTMECNFNPLTSTYNPHLHILVQNEAMADILISEWLKLWKKTNGKVWTNRKAQHKRPVLNMEHDLIECIKYGTKIFTGPDTTKKSKKTIDPTIYVSAFDNIVAAMKGHRLLDRFGFNSPRNMKVDSVPSFVIANYENWSFDLLSNDWINENTNEALSGYELSADLRQLLEEKVNREFQ